MVKNGALWRMRGNVLLYEFVVRQVAPFSAILSNLDKPKCTGHVHEVFYAFPTPLDTPGGHPGVPRSGPGVPGSQLDFPRGTPRSIERRRKRVEYLMYMTCVLGFVQIRQNGRKWCHLAHSTHEYYPLLARCAAGVIYGPQTLGKGQRACFWCAPRIYPRL